MAGAGCRTGRHLVLSSRVRACGAHLKAPPPRSCRARGLRRHTVVIPRRAVGPDRYAHVIPTTHASIALPGGRGRPPSPLAPSAVPPRARCWTRNGPRPDRWVGPGPVRPRPRALHAPADALFRRGPTVPAPARILRRRPLRAKGRRACVRRAASCRAVRSAAGDDRVATAVGRHGLVRSAGLGVIRCRAVTVRPRLRGMGLTRRRLRTPAVTVAGSLGLCLAVVAGCGAPGTGSAWVGQAGSEQTAIAPATATVRAAPAVRSARPSATKAVAATPRATSAARPPAGADHLVATVDPATSVRRRRGTPPRRGPPAPRPLDAASCAIVRRARSGRRWVRRWYPVGSPGRGRRLRRPGRRRPGPGGRPTPRRTPPGRRSPTR